MTDIAQATPAAMDLNLGKSAADGPSADKKVKPEKPNEDEYKKELAAAEKSHQANMKALDDIKKKLDIARPNKDSPTAQKQAELRAELKKIRDQQSANKSSRGNTKEKLDSLDAQLKSRIQEQKNGRSQLRFKSQEELDSHIAKLEKQVGSGTMKIVDEKKTLAEIFTLKKQGKNFKVLEDQEKGIAEVKAQIAEVKKALDNPEQKALSEKYTIIAKELDAIKSEQDEAFKSLNTLRDDRTKFQAAQQETYQAIRAIKDKYYQALNLARDWEREAHRQRQEKFKAERDAENRARRRRDAEAELDTARFPAFTEEIRLAENLIKHLDPNTPAEQKVLIGPSGFAAEPQRKVDASKIEGTVLSKKEDREESYFAGTGGKKGKKGRKINAETSEAKFQLPYGVVRAFSDLPVEAPSSQVEVPATVEKLKAAVTDWKSRQAEETKKNIAAAQAKIDKEDKEAEAEEAGAGRSRDDGRKLARKNAGLNGDKSAAQEKAQEEDGAADAAEELKKASIEDKQS